MKSLHLFFAAAMMFAAAASAQQTTYTVTKTGGYTNFANYNHNVSCANAFCADFTTSMGISGTFTTSSPLEVNLNNALLDGQNGRPSVVSFSFSDGLTTYSSSDPKVAIYQFGLYTNSSGVIPYADIILERWTTSPGTGNFLDVVYVGDGYGYHNLTCASIGTAPIVVQNTLTTRCNTTNSPSSSSEADGATVSYSSPTSPTLTATSHQQHGVVDHRRHAGGGWLVDAGTAASASVSRDSGEKWGLAAGLGPFFFSPTGTQTEQVYLHLHDGLRRAVLLD